MEMIALSVRKMIPISGGDAQMLELRREYDRADGHYAVILSPPEREWLDLEVELPNGRKLPCRYHHASNLLESRLAEREEYFAVPPMAATMVKRVAETLSPEVIAVAQATISEFLKSIEA
jgi:hypothetical protein